MSKIVHPSNTDHQDVTYMKAGVVQEYGHPDNVLQVQSNVFTIPSLGPKATKKEQKALTNKMLVKIQAVSLSPGDYRMIMGDKTVACNPSSWPYIPLGDICGVVQQVPTSTSASACPFQVGDSIVATWDVFGSNGLAEYALVDWTLAAAKPPSISPIIGAALANSATHAIKAIRLANVQKGDRVLVLGGSGGVGTVAVQEARRAGASYVATTSTDEQLMQSLGVDRVINYQDDNEWWKDLSSFDNQKFDVVIDCAVGVEAFRMSPHITKGKKDGGRFVAVVLNEWQIEVKTIWQLITFLLQPLGRQLLNPFRRSTPAYRMYVDGVNGSDIGHVIELVSNGDVKIPIDAESPHSFTTEGVREAFRHLMGRKGHGKIVIEISE